MLIKKIKCNFIVILVSKITSVSMYTYNETFIAADAKDQHITFRSNNCQNYTLLFLDNPT